jgi:phosphatidylinositol alpha-mannosyltransferase
VGRLGAVAERPAVLFVCLTGGLGGSTRSVATVLTHIGGRATRVVAGPPRGRFTRLVAERGLADERVDLPHKGNPRLRALARARAAVRLARWARANRGRLAAIHANGPEEINVAAPAALYAGVPLVVWAHAWTVPPSARRFGRIWGRLLRGHPVHYAAVSALAARMFAEAGYTDVDAVTIVPNPIDGADVAIARRHAEPEGVTVGFLGSADRRKGVDLLPSVIGALDDLPVRWMLFTPRTAELEPVEELLRNRPDLPVEWPGLVADVREAYARVDVVFCPSRLESFCRVVAEAMLNGIPVVASDLEPIRTLVGDDEAGLLFPTGNAREAAHALRRIVKDAALRSELGTRGRARAAAFEPAAVVDRLAELYGLGVSR